MASSIVIQNYRAEQFPLVEPFYESLRTGAPGFHRSGAQFRYFTDYPGVSDDTVFVAMDGDRLAGLMVLAIAARKYISGRIIELAARDAEVEIALIRRAEAYCREKNADALEVNCPAYAEPRHAFKGWVRIDQRGALMAKPLAARQLLGDLLSRAAPHDASPGGKVFFVCRDLETATGGIGHDAGNVQVVHDVPAGALSKGDIRIDAESKILLGVIFGSINLYSAIIKGQIRFPHPGSVFRAVRILRRARIAAPWMVAIADER